MKKLAWISGIVLFVALAILAAKYGHLLNATSTPASGWKEPIKTLTFSDGSQLRIIDLQPETILDGSMSAPKTGFFSSRNSSSSGYSSGDLQINTFEFNDLPYGLTFTAQPGDLILETEATNPGGLAVIRPAAWITGARS